MDIKPLQSRLLEMMVVFDEFCQKHKLQYWLSQGSLLGAIRHNGFIPWDDDMDICMIPDDFYKLEKLSKAGKLPNTLMLQTNSDLNAPDAIKENKMKAKVRDLHSTLIEHGESGDEPYSHGAFIDLFVVYTLPGEKPTRSLKILDELMHLPRRSLIYYQLARPILKLLQCKRIAKHILRRKMVPLNKSTLIKHPSFIAYQHFWKKDEIFPLKRHHFEAYQFLIPSNYHNYLTDLFGDYTQLPAVHQQKLKHTKSYATWIQLRSATFYKVA